MKRIMLLLTAIILAAATGVSAKGGLTVGQRFGTQDTIVVKMPNGAKMILQVENMQQLKSFQTFSLDSLMRVVNEYVQKTERLQGNGASNTTVTVTPSGNGTSDQVVVTVEEKSGDGKVTKERHEVRINKVFKVDVEVEEGGDTSRVKINFPTRAERDSTRAKQKEDRYKATRFNFDMDLGLNALANNNDAQAVPDLSTMGSRYVALNYHLLSQVGGRRSPFYIVSGLEFAFNNYMFDGNIWPRDVNDVTSFERMTDISIQKSKITSSSVNVPLMAMLKFKGNRGKDGFHIGVGGFGGYRLGAHSKVKYTEDGRNRKDKDRNNFNLTDFQYGATGVIGYNDLTLFAKYNANTLFKENRGPESNVVSFGFRLFFD
ncbi:outer membrane beta-barrel protein [Pontibacter sp. SGAir0037]|uniref:outer membrane beta-barrel protein n=1 Tax=Pontibacter sp. SGAir0037 TaxID=2571030 RepID=UPI0010CCC89E|nr:outer membrane beta-barrel protein [Pontibacter sp. SGAir0037]QCR21939.1 PorT family protein [Pontibacter sp. SGAir0037]